MYNDRIAQKADTLTLKIILSVDSSVCVEKKHEKALTITTKTKNHLQNKQQTKSRLFHAVRVTQCRGRLHAPRAHQTDNNAAEEILEDEGFTVLCHFGRENRKCCYRFFASLFSRAWEGNVPNCTKMPRVLQDFVFFDGHHCWLTP